MPEAENIKLGPNYIRLINRFWLKDLEVGFSHLEVHLYFKLLEVNNRLGWKKSFKYPNSRLGSEVGARQKNLIEARRKLIDCGLIRYEKGTTREAGVYQLLSEGVTKESNQESNEESNYGINNQDYDQKCDQKAEQKKVIRGTLTKPNKKKQNKTNTPTKPPIPSLKEFLEYAKANEPLFSEKESGIEQKYRSWVENGWMTGKDRYIKNWKSTLLNTLAYIPAHGTGRKSSLETSNFRNYDGKKSVESF